jgi:hypothetical protein
MLQSYTRSAATKWQHLCCAHSPAAFNIRQHANAHTQKQMVLVLAINNMLSTLSHNAPNTNPQHDVPWCTDHRLHATHVRACAVVLSALSSRTADNVWRTVQQQLLRAAPK